MSRDAYFSYLAETAEVVGPLLGRVLEPYKEQHPQIYNDLMVFAGTRLKRPLQKPALFRLAYEICGGEEWQRFAPIAAAFEILNISSYQANASFDSKLGTLSDEQKDAQFICSMISREIAVSVIDECSALSAVQRVSFLQDISHINEHIYLAQYRDLFILTLSRRCELLADEQAYRQAYEERCRLGSGIFNGEICRWGGVLAAASDAQINALAAFGEAFGTALQVANDIGDYAPDDPDEPNPRDYQDKNSDFRNGRVTAILWWLLHEGSAFASRVSLPRSGEQLSSEDRKALAALTMTTGAYDYARDIASAHLSQAKRHLLAFTGRPEKDLLEQLASIVLNNKYSVAFRKAV